jgi:hypothetical protein
MARRYRLTRVAPHLDDGRTRELAFESTDEFDVLRLTFRSEVADAIKDVGDRRKYLLNELRAMAIEQQDVP